MVSQINYNNTEQALQKFFDSCYAVSHSTVNGYKNAIIEKQKDSEYFSKKDMIVIKFN